MNYLKRGTALILSILIVLLSFNVSVFAADEKSGINENGAVPGTPLTLSYSQENEKTSYVWYVDGKKIDCDKNTYTPAESDLEKFIKVEVYNGDTLAFEDERFCSKLPVVYINTEGGQGITSKEDYIDAKVKITGTTADAKAEYDGKCETKGHGNSTWTRFPKKSYKLKLDKKTDLFGMGKNKHWLLIANYIDESVMRNMSSTELARIFGADSNSAVWVDVVLNGKCIGNYTLFEHTKIGSTRVNIFDWEDAAGEIAGAVAKKEELTDEDEDAMKDMLEKNLAWMTSGKFTYKDKEYIIAEYYTELPESINGGCLMELDNNFDEISKFYTNHDQPIMFKNPEYLNTNDEAFNTIKAYIQDFEDALYSGKKYIAKDGKKVSYTDLCDIETFVTYFLASETLISEYGYRSTYFNKDIDGVIKFGPIWDFDFSSDSVNPFGNYYGQLDADYWSRNDNGNWFGIAMKDPYFAILAQELFNEKLDELKDMVKDGGTVDKWYDYVKESALNNNELWPYARGFEKDFKVFKSWLTDRISWMEKQLYSESSALKSFGIELAADISLTAEGASKVGDIAYVLPSAAKSAVLEVVLDEEHEYSDCEYYLNGKPCGELSFGGVGSLDSDSTAYITIQSSELKADGKDNVVTVRAVDENGNIKTACAVLRLTDDSTRKITLINGEEKTSLSVQNGKSFTLPEVKDKDVIFVGWSDGTDVFDGGKVLRADTDKTFTAVYTPCNEGIKHSFEEKDGKLVCTLCQEDKQADKNYVSITKCTFDIIGRYTTRYTGNPMKPRLTVYYGDRTLTEGVDYTLICYNNVNPGFAFYTIKGIESAGFVGETTKAYGIIQTEVTRIPASGIKFDKAAYEYTGKAITPKLSLSYAGNPLVEGRDYTLSYENNTKIGLGSITITGIGNFNSTRVVKFKILPPDVKNFKASTSATAVKLTWSKSLGATGYRVYRFDEKKKSWVRLAEIAGTSYTVSKLSASAGYKFAVRAYTNVGGTDYPSASYPQLTVTTNPYDAANLKATSDVAGVKLTWSKAAGATGYGVYRYDTKAKQYKKIADTKNTTYTVKGLKVGTSYKFAVRSYAKLGNTVYKSVSYPEVKVTVRPSDVKNLKASSDATSVKLTWSKASGATGYRVFVYNTKTKKYSGVGDTKGTTYTVKNLKLGSSYKFAVRAYAKVGGELCWSGSYPQISVATKLSAVTNLKASASATSVKLTWSKVSGAACYRVFIYNTKTKRYSKVADTKSTTYTVKNLKLGANYKFAVNAYAKVGSKVFWGRPYPQISVTTKLSAVTNLKASPNSKSIKLTWNKVSGAASYRVFRYDAKTGTWKKVADTKNTTYTVTGLKSGTKYRFAVRAYANVGKTTHWGAALTQLSVSTKKP